MCSWIATENCTKISDVPANERHLKYDNQSQHSCSEQECYGRSGFCDCNGNYEFDEGEPDFSCEETSRENRCNMSWTSGTSDKTRKAYRNVLCNEMCQNYNCTYTLYTSADCSSSDAFDHFTMYGTTKYGDFPPQYRPTEINGVKKCMYADNPEICPGMEGAWYSTPQACDNVDKGPWFFKSVKINQEGCTVRIYPDLNQHGNATTVTYDPSKVKEGETGSCINFEMTSTRSAFSGEQCSTRRCTQKVEKGQYNPKQYRLAGRGVLWNDCVQFRDAMGMYCQNYPGVQGQPQMKEGDLCQLWDGAFQTTNQPDINANILKNSTVIKDNLGPFNCAIIDTCNLPPTHVAAPTPAHAVR